MTSPNFLLRFSIYGTHNLGGIFLPPAGSPLNCVKWHNIPTSQSHNVYHIATHLHFSSIYFTHSSRDLMVTLKANVFGEEAKLLAQFIFKYDLVLMPVLQF